MQRGFALAYVLALSAVSFAADAWLAADSRVASSFPTKNFGANGSLLINIARTQSFIPFDLSTLPGGTTASIAKAIVNNQEGEQQ